jgi:NTP pyrophosphatase (non-canonical NTP hydrolase)
MAYCKERQIIMDKIMYYLYHIPGKKIGVTRDLNNRVTKQQGYFPDEYEVLDHSTDIDYISKREIELQQSYGYKIDRVEYKNLGKKMKINATEMTSTFPYPLNKLKGNLMDNMGKTWETVHGKFKLDRDTINWIVDNAQTSMYDAKRSYIYNKAFFEKFVNKNLKQAKVNAKEAADKALEHIEAMKAELISHSRAIGSNETYQDLENKKSTTVFSRFQDIRDWAEERGLYDKGDTKTQFCKLMEEAGELGRAVLKDNQPEFVDAIGDMVVVLTNMAMLGGTSIETCIDAAYDEIKNRKGKMVNGTFVKNG